MKQGNFDITVLPEDGYVIFPLSMSRLANAQSAEELYKFLQFFDTKISKISIDVVFLYTNDLYLNSDEKAVDLRQKSLNQMLYHKEKFMSLVLKDKKYVPATFHFIPWDYTILNSEDFSGIKSALLKARETDSGFQEALLSDLSRMGKEVTETNYSFLIEEIAVSYLLSQKRITLPHTLATAGGWRLICYPGTPNDSWVYTYAHKVLPYRQDMSNQDNLFSHSLYDINERILIDFDQLKD